MRKKLSISNIIVFSYFATALLILLYSLLSGRVDVTTDFNAIIPSGGISESAAKAEKKLMEENERHGMILVSSPDFEKARAGAIHLYDALCENDDGMFSSLNLYMEEESVEPFLSFLSANKYLLMGDEERNMIENSPDEFLSRTVGKYYSSFALPGNFRDDPFLISSDIASRYIETLTTLTPFSPRDGVLAAEQGGVYSVLIELEFSDEGANIFSGPGVDAIYETGDEISSLDGVEISYSGLLFHSSESSGNAMRETTIISTVSIILIALLFVITLRSLDVILFFFASTFFSFLSAFSFLTLFFPNMHILTAMFGTTLIGTSIDYAIHYFIAYRKRNPGEDAAFVVGKIRKALLVSFLSTVLCYLLVFFSPYSILKEVALFSSFGLLGSYLAVSGIFPLVSRGTGFSGKALVSHLPKARERRSLIVPLFIAFSILFIFSFPRISVHNDITNLYTPSERLLESEKKVSSIMGYLSTTYAIVEGNDEMDAREKEALFSKGLETLEAEGAVGGFISPSLFLPSPSEVEKNIKAAGKLSDMLPKLEGALGLEFDDDIEIPLESASVLSFENLPDAVRNTLSSLFLGEVDGKYALLVLVRDTAKPDEVKALAESMDGVTYFQTRSDISSMLDDLTWNIIRLFFIALLLMLLLLVVFYKKKGLLMALSPLSIIFVTLSFSTFVPSGLDFFYTTGMLLVIGLGLDYMVFSFQEGEKPLLAITLSYLTTALSFGSLSFSSFRPVSILGLSVLVGITTAYLMALFSGRKA